MKSTYSYITESFQNEYKHKTNAKSYDYRAIHKDRLIEWRKETNSVVKVDKPTNISRARSLGYKAKQGYCVARVRVRKGSGLKRRPVAGRKPKRMATNKLTRQISNQTIAEQRAQKKFSNMEVLNSYYVGEDGTKLYYEVILVDPFHPVIRSDKKIYWIAEKQNRKRVYRGLTSSGKKSRGLAKKGKGAEKIRPSRNAVVKKRLAKQRKKGSERFV